MRHTRKSCWLVALVVLLINDHLLKGSGWLPGSITGKLSDFAGLIVAVVLLTQLIRHISGWSGRTRRRFAQPSDALQWSAALLVGVGFAATELSPTAAAAVCDALGMIGVSWKLWPDPTDLIALSVLPWAVWIARDPWDATEKVEPDARHPRRRGVGHGLATSMSALACLATSDIDYTSVHALVANDTEDTWVVDLSVLPGVMSCAGPHLEDGILLRTDFAHAKTTVMNTRDVIYVDSDAGLFPDAYIYRELEPGEDERFLESRCLPVRVAIRRGYGQPETTSVVIGLTAKRREFDGRVSSLEVINQNDDNMVVIKERKGKVSLHVGKHLYTIKLADRAPPAPEPHCALPPLPAFITGDAALVVEDIRPETPDCLMFSGILSADVPAGSAGAAGAAGAAGTLAIPIEERNIVACPGPDVVTMGQSLTHTMLRSAPDAGILERHDLFADNARILSTLSLDAATARPECPQVRTDCGAIIVRADPPEEASHITPAGWVPGTSWITIVGQSYCHPWLRRAGETTAYVGSPP